MPHWHVCAGVNGCAPGYLRVHIYFEKCRTFGLGHVPVAVVLIEGFIQNGSILCVCVCAIQRQIHMFVYIPIAMQADC